ncbi:ABC transporter ATP-binding protein [Labilibaculum euxinus]|uniref:ATP-binding cassette domain-containing protein n=1 Tax=Labilibaculum euxinus TaxID=2686357 RepID=A0A7M4D4N2_9BACT|nr:ABC transporter ATP-binding protein [Labilibaculum euxinus]MUP37611.1 ATP-binding cassette domain-containing protein [Labilibaculum euxinus]MVB06816.1 ATP-binding cassette domain-containing protein [Labilibaculum euxinus]
MQINIQELSKIYPNGKKALDNVNLEIGTGMFGLLGPNGAGKSSLMRILVTLMKPSIGSVSIDSFDLEKNRKEIRSMLGYLPQDFRFFSKLKTWEFLDYAASLSGIKNKNIRRDKVDEWLDKVGLFDVRERDANKLSGGMKRRLGIAQTLIGNPKIIVVDEPTTGLDPEERIRFRNILSELSQQDVIIILSTHIVGDISSVCNNLALLNNGQVAFKGTPEALIEKARGHVWQVNTSGYEYDLIKDKYPVVSTIPTQEGWEVQLIGDGSQFTNAIELEPNLEHAYVYFMEMSSALI